MICKEVLIHPVTGQVYLSCDKDDAGHMYHHDAIAGAEWRKDWTGVGVTRISPEPPHKVYVHHPDPMRPVVAVLNAT